MGPMTETPKGKFKRDVQYGYAYTGLLDQGECVRQVTQDLSWGLSPDPNI